MLDLFRRELAETPSHIAYEPALAYIHFYLHLGVSFGETRWDELKAIMPLSH